MIRQPRSKAPRSTVQRSASTRSMVYVHARWITLCLLAVGGASPDMALAQSTINAAELWTASANHCTSQWEICTEIAQRTAAARRSIQDWSGSGSERGIPGQDDGPPPLTEASYQTTVRPTEVTARHLAAWREQARSLSEALSTVINAHDEARQAALESLPRLSRSVGRNLSILNGANRPLSEIAQPAVPTVATMAERTLQPDTITALTEQIAETFALARTMISGEAPATDEDAGRRGRRSPRNRDKAGNATILKQRIAADTNGLRALLEEIDWSNRYLSVDDQLLLDLQKLIVAFEVLYAEDLALYVSQRRDFTRSQHLTILTQMAQGLTRLREQAAWTAVSVGIRDAFGAHADAVDTVMYRHGTSRFSGNINPGGRERVRTPKICLLDRNSGIAGILDAELTGRSANGIYEIDFNPQTSEASIESNVSSRTCVATQTISSLSDTSPTKLIDAVLGMNAYLALQVEQVNWYQTHLEIVEDFERSSIQLAGRLQRLAGAVEADALAIARRGVEIGCGMSESVDFADSGAVIFDVEVRRGGEVSSINLSGQLPDGFNERRFQRQIRRSLRCQSYDPYVIDGDRIETLKTIQLEIQDTDRVEAR